MSLKRYSSKAGFTLIELTIVLLIIGLITALAAASGISIVASARQSATQSKIEALQQSLQQYRLSYNRLPCPADLTIAEGAANFGVEAANAGSCTGGTPSANRSGTGTTNTGATAVEGTIPVATLGLPNDFMYDGWGHRIRYAVDIAATATNAFTSLPAACVNRALTVNDANGNARSTGAVYALISHGATGHGGYSKNGVIASAGSTNTAEQTNCHCDSSANATSYSPTYVQEEATQNPAIATDKFDGLVMFKERWQMIASWEKMQSCQYMYVPDTYDTSGYGRIQKFDTNGNFVSALWSVGGYGNGSIVQPVQVLFDSSGNMWVLERGNKRVQKFDSHGTPLAVFNSNADSYFPAGANFYGVQGSANGIFQDPTSFAMDASGNIWVADSSNNRLQKFSNAGVWLQSFGGPSPYTCTTSPSASVPACPGGAGDGQFQGPSSIVIDSMTGNIYVKDNTRVQKLSSTGAFVSSFPVSNSSGDALAMDAGGNFWVGNAAGGCHYQKYDSNGTLLATYGSCGSGDGQWYSIYGDIFTLDSSGNIWISDSDGARVEEVTSSGVFIKQMTCASGACPGGNTDGILYSPKKVTFYSN